LCFLILEVQENGVSLCWASDEGLMVEVSMCWGEEARENQGSWTYLMISTLWDLTNLDTQETLIPLTTSGTHFLTLFHSNVCFTMQTMVGPLWLGSAPGRIVTLVSTGSSRWWQTNTRSSVRWPHRAQGLRYNPEPSWGSHLTLGWGIASTVTCTSYPCKWSLLGEKKLVEKVKHIHP
jgi:hypothetical protein